MLPSTLLNILYERTQALAAKKYWMFTLGVFFVIVILVNGIAIVPEEPYQRLSQNPFITRTDIHFNNYWQESPLLPLIAYYLGLTGTITFNVLTLVTIIGAYGLFTWLTLRRWGPMPSLVLSTLLITSPLTTTLLSWLGTPDGLIVALTVPFLFSQSSILMIILAVPGAANHPTFIIAALEVLALRWSARDKINLKHIILTVIGALLGYGLVRFFLYTYGINVVSRVEFMQLKHISEWVSMNVDNLPISIFSLFNIHWLTLLVCLSMFFKKDKLFYSMVLLASLINYGMTFFTLDTTRIFSLLSWGVLFMCILHSYKLASSIHGDDPDYLKQLLEALIIIGLISFITPRYYSWAGEIHTTPFYELTGWLTK